MVGDTTRSGGCPSATVCAELAVAALTSPDEEARLEAVRHYPRTLANRLVAAEPA